MMRHFFLVFLCTLTTSLRADTFEKIFETQIEAPSLGAGSLVHRLNFDTLHQPVGGPGGQILFAAQITGLADEAKTAWYFKEANHPVVYLGFAGGPAPLLPSGVVMEHPVNEFYKWGRSGELYFRVPLRDAAGTQLGNALYCAHQGQLKLLLSHQTVSPLGGIIDRLEEFYPVTGATSCTAIASIGARIADASGGHSYATGVMRLSPIQNSLVFRFDTDAPGVPGFLLRQAYTQMRVNARGDILLMTGMASSPIESILNFGLWIYRNGIPELIVRTGQPAPGVPGFILGWIDRVELSDSGDIAFGGGIADTSNQQEDWYLWTRRGGSTNFVFSPGANLQLHSGYRYHSNLQYRTSGLQPEPIKYLDDGSLIFSAWLWGPQSTETAPQLIRSFWKLTGSQSILFFKDDDQLIDKLGRTVTLAPYAPLDRRSIASNGKMAIATAFLPVGGQNEDRFGGILSNASGSFRILAQDGQGLPDTGGYSLRCSMAVWGESWNWPLSGIEINRLGQILISSSISRPGETRGFCVPLRISASGQIRPLVKERQTLSLEGLNFDVFLSATRFGSALSDDGSMPLAMSTIRGGSDLRELIVRGRIEEPVVSACRADMDGSGNVAVGDLFIFLERWFAHNMDFNGDGMTSLEDLFQYLGAYFEGCPG